MTYTLPMESATIAVAPSIADGVADTYWLTHSTCALSRILALPVIVVCCAFDIETLKMSPMTAVRIDMFLIFFIPSEHNWFEGNTGISS